MEEKERFELFGEHCIKDNNPDARCQLLDAYVACVILNEQDKENQQLRQQLAESEKNFIIVNNLRKNSNEVLLNYKTEKYGLDKTIEELRKIKLSFPEKEWYYKGFENCERQMSSHIADLTLEVKELKQQLTEKERQLKLAEELLIKQEKEYDEQLEKQAKIHYKHLKEKDQDKISFAVEQLEKLKVELHIIHTNGYLKAIDEEIDNQIKQLKEIANEK